MAEPEKQEGQEGLPTEKEEFKLQKEPAAPPAAPVVKEVTPPEKKIQVPSDFVSYWAHIKSHVSININKIDPPVEKVSATTGSILFVGFEGLPAKAFRVRLYQLMGSTAEAVNASAELDAAGILLALSDAVNAYLSVKKEDAGKMSVSMPGILREIFAAVFEKIAEKADEKINWSSGVVAGSIEGKVVEKRKAEIESGERLEGLNVTVLNEFTKISRQLEVLGSEILKPRKGKKEEKEKKEHPQWAHKEAIARYVLSLPEEDFMQEKVTKDMFTWKTEEQVGPRVMEAIKFFKEQSGATRGGDVSNYWYTWEPDKKRVGFVNRRLTSKKNIEEFARLARTYKALTPEGLYKNIANQLEITVPEVIDWFKKKLNKLVPEDREKVEKILDLEPTEKEKEQSKELEVPKLPPLAKEAYGPTWAGPSLDEVGKLVGTPQAQWASELAGKLAAEFDYISFPALAGSPTELKKEAALPPALTEEQRDFVEKYVDTSRNIARRLVKNIYTSDVAGQGEAAGFLPIEEEEAPEVGSPRSKGKMPLHHKVWNKDTGRYEEALTYIPVQKWYPEVDRMADDVLLKLISEGRVPTTTPEKEFLELLNQELRKKVNELYKGKYQITPSEWPSYAVGPEDITRERAIPFHPTKEEAETLEEAGIEKVAGHPLEFKRVKRASTGDHGTSLKVNDQKPGDIDVLVLWDNKVAGIYDVFEADIGDIVFLNEEPTEEQLKEARKVLAQYTKARTKYEEDFKKDIRNEI